jgi:glyoxalase family protein
MTDDLARADAFLGTALGLSLVKQSVNQDDPSTLHHFWASYDGRTVAPHSAYSLFGWPRDNALRARAGVGQAHHVAFRAPDADALDAWRDRLLASGIDAGSPWSTAGGGAWLLRARRDGVRARGRRA